MRVIENVAYGPRMRGMSRRARRKKASEFLDLSGFPISQSATRTSFRVACSSASRWARALANEPEVLLLDEPLGALDRKLRDEMQRELRRVQSELKATFIYVTHDQDDAFGMADRLAVMRDGRFEQIGAPADLYDRPNSAWVSLFVGSANTVLARVERSGEPARLATSIRTDRSRLSAARSRAGRSGAGGDPS